jgi:hypothetical protein
MSVRWLTVTLSNAAPVRIDRDQWGILAEAQEQGGVRAAAGGGTSPPAWTRRLIVRRAPDGRVLVYGVCTFAIGPDRRGGELLDYVALSDKTMAPPSETEIVVSIRRVAESLGFPTDIALRCVANLPARILDAKEGT